MSATPSVKQQERLMQVLLAPVISEKSTFVADKHEQVIFRVVQNATKPEIKAAVELMFKVQVESVQVANVKGKEKRFGRFMGRRPEEGLRLSETRQEINFAEGEAGTLVRSKPTSPVGDSWSRPHARVAQANRDHHRKPVEKAGRNSRPYHHAPSGGRPQAALSRH